MKASTIAQILNAECDKAPANYVVISGVSVDNMKQSEPMTYRQAKAKAKAIKEACKYAIVKRI